MANYEILVAKDSFVTAEGVAVAKGATMRTGHPLMKGREHLFRRITVDYDYDFKAVEAQAAKDAAAAAKSAKAAS